MKPYYDHNGITIYNADCRDILPTLDRVDLVLTDIPYMEVNRPSNGLTRLDRGQADECTFNPIEEVINNLASVNYVWCGIGQVSDIRANMIASGLSTRLIIWEKTNPSPMNGQHIWLSGIECCVYGKASSGTHNASCRNTVIQHPLVTGNGHPTPKPVKIFEDLVLVSSNNGDLVLDPFMGSGTTLVAAKQLGRKCIGIELEEKYCEIAVKRLQQEYLAV